ncbi:hypothetical protein GCM10020256_35630 [Streptomyces thermocoprophilus]|jgi:hypothetical protein
MLTSTNTASGHPDTRPAGPTRLPAAGRRTEAGRPPRTPRYRPAAAGAQRAADIAGIRRVRPSYRLSPDEPGASAPAPDPAA